MSHDSSPEEVIQNLLHMDPAKRRKGFNHIKTYWMAEYREYIYTAIETEKQSTLQLEMIEFILDMLKENSLRKMIRFEEKGVLHTKSRQQLILSYVRYETPLVREALVKSLRRPETKIPEFIVSLINSSAFLTDWGRNPSQLYEFLEDCLDPSIENSQRFPIIHAFFSRYISHSNFRSVVGTRIFSFLRSRPILHIYILQEFFDPQTKSNKVKANLSWKNWTWSTGSTSLRHTPFRSTLSEFDEFLLLSLQGEPEVIATAIPILGQMAPSYPPTHNKAYEEKMRLLWDRILTRNLLSDLLEFDEITYEDFEPLSNRLDLPIAELDQELNLHELLDRIYAYLPREKLIGILNEEDSILRSHVYTHLQNIRFFSTETTLLTPPSFWDTLFDNAFSKTNHSEREIDAMTQFCFHLIRNIQNLGLEDKNTVFAPLLDLLKDDQSPLHSLEFWSIRYLMSVFNESEMPPISKEEKLTTNQLLIIIDHFLYFDCPVSLSPAIIDLIEEFDLDSVFYLQGKFENNFQDEWIPSATLLLNKLLEHQDVRVRSKSRLILKKLNL
ncbi:MAG: hypothetical protein ACXAE3_13385 [Candidatus Kariarchaeaceae archaeon]